MPIEDAAIPVDAGAMSMDSGGRIDASCGTTCCNAMMDPTESDVDCGGPCAKCAGGKTCVAATDCASLVCTAAKLCDGPAGMVGTGPCMGKKAGDACTDPACPMNTMCDAFGNCGIVGNCATMPDTNCEKSTYAGHAYWTCNQNENWQDAQTKCAAVGLDLAHIDDMAENTHVAAQINANGNDAWIGATVFGGAWVWIDDNSTITFAMGWNGGTAPSPVANQCAWSNDKGEWSAQVCTINHGYVCEGVLK